MPRVLPSQVVQVIEKYFPQTKLKANIGFNLDRGDRNECVSIARLVDQIPIELLNPPLMEDYVKLISNIAILNFTLESWKTLSRSHIDDLTGKSEGNPISVIHDTLQKCPDEAISPKTAGLEFIEDINFRDSLRSDLTSVTNALSNGEWKATTVLAGSIAEALLLWAINKEKQAKQNEIAQAMQKHGIKENDFNRWSLEYCNKVAMELQITKPTTYAQIDIAREFRDLIHPGREIRKKAKCSIATAYSAIAAFQLIIEDLSEKYRIL